MLFYEASSKQIAIVEYRPYLVGDSNGIKITIRILSEGKKSLLKLRGESPGSRGTRVFIPVVSVSHTGHSDLQRSPPSGALPISSAPLSAYAQQGKVLTPGKPRVKTAVDIDMPTGV